MSAPPTLDNLDGIAAIYPHEPDHFSVVRAQVEQRAQLVKTWDIHLDEKVLEIGCGQGDCTVVLATVVGDEGSVTALDPASLDYGSPYTLGQAQAHLRASSVGHRINFVQADPIAFLQSSTEHYTTAVLAQCTWYFAAPHVFSDILAALLDRVDRVCISEYALTSSDYRAMPHILATFAQAALECRKTTSTANVRSLLAPERLRAAALAVGLSVKAETVMQPPDGMLDGTWEAGYVLSRGFEEEVDKYVSDEREKAVYTASIDSIRATRGALKAKGDRGHTMDIWVATFAKAT